jgi:hypothetical protein
MGWTQASAPSDFALERYKADRAHELELNKATAEYEHAWLRVVTALNGGAAGAFVTFLGVVWKAGEHSWQFPVFALVSWAAGLLVISAATNMALQAQTRYAGGLRLWREIEEIRQFKKDNERRLSYERQRKEADQPRRWFSLRRPITPLVDLSLEEWFTEQAKGQFRSGGKHFLASVLSSWTSVIPAQRSSDLSR